MFALVQKLYIELEIIYTSYAYILKYNKIYKISEDLSSNHQTWNQFSVIFSIVLLAKPATVYGNWLYDECFPVNV